MLDGASNDQEREDSDHNRHQGWRWVLRGLAAVAIARRALQCQEALLLLRSSSKAAADAGSSVRHPSWSRKLKCVADSRPVSKRARDSIRLSLFKRSASTARLTSIELS